MNFVWIDGIELFDDGIYLFFVPFRWSKESTIHHIVGVEEVIYHYSFVCLQSPMSHHTCTCKDIAERVDVMGLLNDEAEYPVHQLGFTTYIPTTLQRESSHFDAIVHKHQSSFMAVAWLIDT